MEASDEADDEENTDEEKMGIRKRISSYFRGSETDDGLTFRQRLGKMGLATVLSYGWISNTNAMVLVAAAWYVFSAKVSFWKEILICLVCEFSLTLEDLPYSLI